jgi:predicted alpha/beta superfamily hydrolase
MPDFWRNPRWTGWRPYSEAHPGARVAGDIRVHTLDGDASAREVLVWLPPSLRAGGTAASRYPVLYMQDGQNLFDEATSFAGEWGVDEAAEAAARDGAGEVVVVGVANAGEKRAEEYLCWPSEMFGAGGGGRAYLDFLVATVRPLVESTWPVRTDPAGVGIAGSSLGGLIALCAALERPDEYGFAGVFSPAVVAAEREVLELARERAKRGMRVYLDVGRREWLRGGYVGAVRTLRDLLRERGADLLYVEDDHDHNEIAWRERFPVFLRWFLTNIGPWP